MTRPAPASFTRLEEMIGSNHVCSDAVELARRQVDGANPSTIVRPGDTAQVAEIVRLAAAEQLAVIPSGAGTKLGIGSPAARYDIAVDLSRMNRVLAYDPQDLTLGVEPGVRLQDLSRVLEQQNQFLPLAVPFAEHATIGGIVASNSSSPLRQAYGGVRDFCLGMEFVTGEGVAAKSGGCVVKNVTGYDLHKLLIGSLGTLAVITRINFRTFPRPPAHGTFVASFPGAEAAFRFCRAIAHSVLAPQMVEVADPSAAHLLFSTHASSCIQTRTWSAVISAAGQADVVSRYAHELGRMATAAGAEEFAPLDDAEAISASARICEFPKLLLEAAPTATIFRIGIVPTALPGLIAELTTLAERNRLDLITLTQASGILYAALLPKEGETPAFATIGRAVREVFNACGKSEINASPMLEWCPVEVKRAAGENSISVWGPPRPDFAQMLRVKRAFDPENVLSPGCFASGI